MICTKMASILKCHTWAGIRWRRWRTRCGRVLLITAGFILCTPIMCRRRIRLRLKAVVITALILPPPWAKTTSLRCSFTRKKATTPAWRCCVISSPGTVRPDYFVYSEFKVKTMLVIPAIDLKDGKCVRLRQGRMDDSTVFGDDPVSMAKRWVDAGCRRLHLVDLNGAFAGTPVNGEAVTANAKAFPGLPIQIGGGIRTLETIEHYIKAGVSYVIIGTKAVKEPAFV